MFQKSTATGFHPVLDKIRQKTLVFGTNTLLTEFRLEQGALLPLHSHPHEQTGYLVTGRLL
jgi:quercetin dioxygenase-like cupin family protein